MTVLFDCSLLKITFEKYKSIIRIESKSRKAVPQVQSIAPSTKERRSSQQPRKARTSAAGSNERPKRKVNLDFFLAVRF